MSEPRTAALVEQCRRYRECPLVSHVVVPLAFLELLQHTLAAQDEEIEALRRERDHYQREARAVLVGAEG